MSSLDDDAHRRRRAAYRPGHEAELDNLVVHACGIHNGIGPTPVHSHGQDVRLVQLEHLPQRPKPCVPELRVAERIPAHNRVVLYAVGEHRSLKGEANTAAHKGTDVQGGT